MDSERVTATPRSVTGVTTTAVAVRCRDVVMLDSPRRRSANGVSALRATGYARFVLVRRSSPGRFGRDRRISGAVPARSERRRTRTPA